MFWLGGGSKIQFRSFKILLAQIIIFLFCFPLEVPVFLEACQNTLDRRNKANLSFCSGGADQFIYLFFSFCQIVFISFFCVCLQQVKAETIHLN